MIDIKKMLTSGVHFGHRTSRWSPAMRPFIWGEKNRVHLIDVSKTSFLLEKAVVFLEGLARQNGRFLWVGTKAPAQEVVRAAAERLSMPYVTNRWLGGTLTNYEQIKKAITRYLYYKEIVDKQQLEGYKKKEIVAMQKEVERLEKIVLGVVNLQYPPAALIIVDAKKERTAIQEATRVGIPVVALVDTNSNPKGVNYIIPANDDSPSSISCIIEYISARVETAAAEGKQQQRAEKASRAAANDEAVKLKAQEAQ